MADVIWPSKVAGQLNEITSYIAQFDPAAADDIGARLVRSGNSLADFPNRGRPAAGGTRELVSVPPYILQYQVYGDTVTILSIRHGARRPLD